MIMARVFNVNEKERVLSVATYGLDDAETLHQAIEMAPELFTALLIARQVPGDRYPIHDKGRLRSELEKLVGTKGMPFRHSTIAFSEAEAEALFPDEFYPVEDRQDLVRKVFMAIVRAHTSDARKNLEAAKSGALNAKPSHPFDLGAL